MMDGRRKKDPFNFLPSLRPKEQKASSPQMILLIFLLIDRLILTKVVSMAAYTALHGLPMPTWGSLQGSTSKPRFFPNQKLQRDWKKSFEKRDIGATSWLWGPTPIPINPSNAN